MNLHVDQVVLAQREMNKYSYLSMAETVIICGQADDTPVEKCVFHVINKETDYEIS